CLAADATQGRAVARIFEAKGRPSFNPLIVHVGDRDWVADFARTDERFERLAHIFWPGPLTFVLQRRPACSVSELVSAGLPSLALRMPAHPIAQEILAAAQRPLAAPSANLSGTVSPTEAAHVTASLGDNVDLVVDGGRARVGIESTVLDLTGPVAAILRPGSVTQEDIARAIGDVTTAAADPTAPKSPGQLTSHYAPSVPLRMNAHHAHDGEALLGFGKTPGATLDLSPGGDLREAAANLFAMIRALDDPALHQGIAVAPVPLVGIGLAINDRLERAARGR
ncbi:MAG: threonylcarbamoyl-AMP synthase, partial [Proteobacteria bacterium]|nr:threonylcarbamoyl-AMP synthase [Pseudomonadota bacterium]